MTWTKCVGRKCELTGTSVVHDGKVVWLWHKEHKSAVYDPAKDKWADFKPEPFEGSGTRVGALVASFADTLVIFSGSPRPYSRGNKPPVGGGVRLDGGVWKPMATKNQPSARTHAVRAWTGRELVVWGGTKGSAPVLNGAAYDPAADTWRKLSTTNAATSHNGNSVWTGTELWLWGGASFSYKRGLKASYGGFAYHVADDRWRALAGVPGDKEDSLNARSIIRFGDAALFVRREESTGSDDDRCQAWRYDPLADMWEPCTPPPEVRGGEPKFIDCDGRLVLRLATKFFEYLPMRDAWAALPELPESTWDPALAWTAGALYAFDRHKDATYRLALPDSVEPVATPSKRSSALVTLRKRPDAGRGSPVTAIALGKDVVTGHADGTVRVAGKVVRQADNARIGGIAVRDGAWTCLVGDRLEGDRKTELPFEAHTLAHDGDRLVVAGDGQLATLAWQKNKWTLVRKAKLQGTTSALAMRGDVIARAVLGPPRRKNQRDKARDGVELIDADKLKPTSTFYPRVERGTTSVIPTADGVLVAGGGEYQVARYAVGKLKPVEKIATDTAWSSPIVMSADGNWLLCRHAGRGGELYELRDKRCALNFVPFDDAPDDVRAEIGDAHPAPAFLPPAEAEALADDARIKGTVSAIAIGATGTPIALGTSAGATFVIDRDTLAIDIITAAGKKLPWQPACGEIVERDAIAIGGELGVVAAVRDDGRYGELDVATGKWTWDRTLPVERVRALRKHAWEAIGVVRRGDAIAVDGEEREIFGKPKPDPKRAVWATREAPKPMLVKLDAITREQLGGITLPSPPDGEADAIWLGGDRWFVALEAGSHVVDTRTEAITALAHGNAVASLDGIHFATPENGDSSRRWHIYGADLAEPVRSIELPDTCEKLAVLPNGIVVLRDRDSLGFIDRDNTLVWFRGLPRFHGMCGAGDALVTWHWTGTIRRWDLRRVFT